MTKIWGKDDDIPAVIEVMGIHKLKTLAQIICEAVSHFYLEHTDTKPQDWFWKVRVTSIGFSVDIWHPVLWSEHKDEIAKKIYEEIGEKHGD